MNDILPLQLELSQPLLEVIGNKDYRTFKQNLDRISELLFFSDIDNRIMQYEIELAEEIAKDENKNFTGLSFKCRTRIQQMARQKLRYVISRKLTGESYRVFSCHLAESFLLQKFCLLSCLDKIKVPSKSSLERYEKEIPEEIIRELNSMLLNAAQSPVDLEKNQQQLLLQKEISLADYYLDATCIKANIHFPVDWVLLRDATRTLMKAITLIRNRGLKNRMDEPAVFINKINKLCIQMTHAKNRKDSKKNRKKILRMMKKLLNKVRSHGQKYKELLELHWEDTEFSKKQADRIIERMDNIISKIPTAIEHAHERIIGGRQVKNKDKILSLYDENIHVIVRGKPEAKVEFGSTLVIGESKNGLIIDWKLYKETAPADCKLLPESLERLQEQYNGYQPENVVTDRGCDSKQNQKLLVIKGINNFLCPRSPHELKIRNKETDFCFHQKRRGQTEARIGIFKNNFLGKPFKSKGFNNKEQNLAWAVLTHNLWVLARMKKTGKVIPVDLKEAS